MSRDLTTIPHKLDRKAHICCAVVETPKGKRSKFDYDAKTGLFKLKSLLPDGMSFPLDFGFIPSTLCDDGDPLDVMILSDEPMMTGALLEIRLIGVIEVEEVENGKKERNDRLLAVSGLTHLFGKIGTLDDLEVDFIDNLKNFWSVKAAQENKDFRILGTRKPGRAVKLIAEASRRARKSR